MVEPKIIYYLKSLYQMIIVMSRDYLLFLLFVLDVYLPVRLFSVRVIVKLPTFLITRLNSLRMIIQNI